MTNSVDPNEPSYLDLHCLHRYLFWYAGLEGYGDFLNLVAVSLFYTGKTTFMTMSS